MVGGQCLLFPRPGWPALVPIREVPKYLRFYGYITPLQLLSPFGWIRKTKAMSAPQKIFLAFGSFQRPFLYLYLVSLG
jgi:hypothetical protein